MEIFSEGKVPVKVVRYSRSKKLRLHINGRGEVKLTAPKRASDRLIKQFIRSQSNWIKTKLAEINQKPKLEIYDGATLNILGEEYEIELKQLPGSKPKVYFDDTSSQLVIFSANPAQKQLLREELEKHLRALAKREISERVSKKAEEMGLRYGRITIREQTSRWGSCSSQGNLNFNWKLILAPLQVLDYVIVHELAHIKELNHSSKFWQIVSTYHPSYRQDKNWLRQKGIGLDII